MDKGCCCQQDQMITCNCVPRLSVAFAIRAYIGVLLVQIVIVILLTVVFSAMGIDIKEHFKQKLL